MRQEFSDIVANYWRKRQEGMEISAIRAELRKLGKYSDDEIRHICRNISDKELDSANHDQSRSGPRGVIVYWFFSVLWLITLITVLVLNDSLLKLKDGMYWLFLVGSLILLTKNIYGLYRKYSNT